MNNKDQKVISFSEFLKKSDTSISDISQYSLKNIFSVVNKGQKSYYNLCNTFNLLHLQKIPSSYYTLYAVKYSDTLTNLSYTFFGTIDAWWIICKLNNITNPFEKLQQGTILKIPNNSLITLILGELN